VAGGYSAMTGEQHAIFGFAHGSASTRQLRARHADLAELVDRSARPAGGGTARRLVQIFDGGSMPSAPDHFFLSYPVELDGSETEGGAGTPTADTTQTIVVDVIGHVPNAGDILTAYAVGGRWVAERSSGSSNICCGFRCATCTIPKHTLVLAVPGIGDVNLVWNGALSLWQSGCVIGLAYNCYFTLSCSLITHSTVLSIRYCTSCDPQPSGGECGTCTTPASSSTCDPLSLVFIFDYSPFPSQPADCTSNGGSLLPNGPSNPYTVTDPDPPDPDVPHCCVTICVNGPCGPIPDATVTVSSGMTTVATGTTNANGCILLDIGTAGTYTVTVSATGYTTVTGSHSLACCGSLAVTLALSSGIPVICCGACGMNSTIYLTDTNGTWAATYNVAQSAWIACYAVSVGEMVPGVSKPGGVFCTPEATQSGNIPVLYLVQCSTATGTTSPSLTVTRYWPAIEGGTWILGSWYPSGIYYDYALDGQLGGLFNGLCDVADSVCTITADPSNPGYGSSALTKNASGCAPFSWSGTLTYGGPAPDPATGTVSLSN